MKLMDEPLKHMGGYPNMTMGAMYPSVGGFPMQFGGVNSGPFMGQGPVPGAVVPELPATTSSATSGGPQGTSATSEASSGLDPERSTLPLSVEALRSIIREEVAAGRKKSEKLMITRPVRVR